MEGVLCKTSSEDIPNNAINITVGSEVFGSNVVLPSKDLLIDRNANPETKVVNGHTENGSKTPTNCETAATEPLAQKTFSPTLIESAFKAMKSLFSPDKSKSKSVSVISPKSASGSPCNSIYVPSVPDPLSLGPGIELLNSIQSVSADSNLKNQLQSELGGVASPLNFDPHNNTDESFLTTASLIDDSFHSAVTHLDEHAEALKHGANFIGNVLNSSQNLDLVDPYNDTLENNDSYLDNTTLKIDNPDGSIETLNGTQINGLFNTSHQPNGSGKDQEQIFEENKPNGASSTENSSKKEESSENGQVSCSLNGTEKGEIKSSENKEMANIFLSNSFHASLQRAESENEVTLKESEMQFENAVDEQDGFIDNAISTTTVVLNKNSSDLGNMLMSLKVSDSDGLTPSFTSLEGSDNVNSSLENLSDKFLLSETGAVPLLKQSLNNNASSATNLFTEQREKFVSDGNSQNIGISPTKLKLNKSDELINRRVVNEALDGKNVQEKKSSVDISLMKNSEASEISKESHPSKVAQSTTEHKSKIDETNLTSAEVEPVPVPVISQLSYTILSHDNTLKRPVIESVSVSPEVSEKKTFQMMQSEERLSTGSGKNEDKSVGKNCTVSNLSFSTEDLVKSSQVKQSTPLLEGVGESVQKFFRPTSLKLYSPEQQNSDAENSEGKIASNNSDPEQLSDATQVFSSNKTPTELSPVNPVNDSTYLYMKHLSNSVQNDGSSDLKSKDPTNTEPVLEKLNETYDKKDLKNEKTPADQKLNETYQKKSDENGNQTFEKGSGNFNSTFTKNRGSEGRVDETFEKSASLEVGQMNKTYDKHLAPLNETFDKKPDLANTTHVIESPGRSETFTFESGQSNKTFDKISEIPANSESTEFLMKAKPDETNKNVEPVSDMKEENDSFSSAKSSSNSVLSGVPSVEEELVRNQSIEYLSQNLEKIILEDNPVEKQNGEGLLDTSGLSIPEGFSASAKAEEKLLNSFKEDKCDPDLVQLIQEQFSPNDIEKICNVVQDLSSMKLSSEILKASEQFDKSFHANFSDADFKPPEMVLKNEKPVDSLSPHSFDFLNSIRGKPTGRDLSRESLYVKFDPLVQPSANSLIDFTKEGEALPVVKDSPPNPHNTSICEQLLAISPEKKPNAIVPPLTPLSSKVKTDLEEDKSEKLKELQNEIYFLKNLYAERERSNKAKMEEYEGQVAKLTGESCFLEDRLKESNEREKSLVKKMKEQNQNIGQLKIIMEEYVKVISKLSAELEELKKENTKQIESLSAEKDSYMTHLQNTEAAFTDVHTKYEKSKKTIVSLKTNEVMYRNTIAEQSQKMEEFKVKAREAQEKALMEFKKIQEELNEAKSSHSQEAARLRAQLKKTELKVDALKESLDQKIKENQQLTAICDELIEGKK